MEIEHFLWQIQTFRRSPGLFCPTYTRVYFENGLVSRMALTTQSGARCQVIPLTQITTFAYLAEKAFVSKRIYLRKISLKGQCSSSLNVQRTDEDYEARSLAPCKTGALGIMGRRKVRSVQVKQLLIGPK